MKRMFVNDVGGKFKVPVKNDEDRTVCTLLWGDSFRVEEETGPRARIRTGRYADGKRSGWIPRSVLTDEGLLEIYVIDVGQGDGVLMRTPDDAWHLIDAGVANEKQMTRKGTANFLRWKFLDDLGRRKVTLETVTVTHPDFDHYGGLLNVLGGALGDGRTFEVEVGALYHSGMGRFASGARLGKTTSGFIDPPPFPDYGVKKEADFITELLDGKGTFASPARPFETTFARFARLAGSVPKKVARLSYQDGFLPGYGDGAKTVVRVLGPVVEQVVGKGPGLRVLGSESVTRNGHSVVFRVEQGKARILLTGDLNTASQRLLLSYHPRLELAADVVKACHHGSDDIDLRFVRAMNARVTVVSSGDNEDYAHPRPRVLGASARYGRESKSVRGELLPPLVYSTELARSVSLDPAAAVRKTGAAATELKAADAEIKPDRPRATYRALTRTPISTNLIYGLINVRTDGDRVLCGYLEESGTDFDIQVFRAGVEP